MAGLKTRKRACGFTLGLAFALRGTPLGSFASHSARVTVLTSNAALNDAGYLRFSVSITSRNDRPGCPSAIALMSIIQDFPAICAMLSDASG